MRNVILGAIGVLWGGAIVVYSLFGSEPNPGGAYGAGQTAGTVFGVLLFAVGLVYLIKGIRSQGHVEKRQPKKGKRAPRDAER